MDAFFLDPDVERLPPESVRLTDLQAEPLGDRQRVHVRLELSPFEKSPEIELVLLSPDKTPCGTASIMEPFSWKLDLTMHIRSIASGSSGKNDHPAGRYEIEAVVSYPEIGEVDRRKATFDLREATS